MKRYSGFEFALLSICLCFGLIACTPFGGFKPPPKWWTYFEGMQSKGYRPVGDVQYLGGCDARCLYP
jgi:hypothetical protein